MITTCEVKIDGKWTEVDIETAVAEHLAELKRCPGCEGRVTHYQGGKHHFGHYTAHAGCRLSWNFNGTPTKHPEPLP